MIPSPLATILAGGQVIPCHPWPRHVLPHTAWRALIDALPNEPHRLLALWADTIEVHALLLHDPGPGVLLVSCPIEAGAYPALSLVRPNAAPFERMIRDLWGHHAAYASDERPWLDHGQWPVTLPLSPRPGSAPVDPEPPAFPSAEADHATRLPIGPVAGLITDAAHLRLTLSGTTVRSAEAHLGYAHKGTLALMRGKSPRAAARFAARLSGDATVAHALAFARAAEAALATEAPPRAQALRLLLQEWERMSVHLGHFAALGALTGAAGLHRIAEGARENLARAAEAAFGHRLLMDIVVPGGVSHDVAPDGQVVLRAALAAFVETLAPLAGALAHPPLASRLSGFAQAPLALVNRCAAGGVVGRASGRAFDARGLEEAHGGLEWEPETQRQGDEPARNRVRLREIAVSVGIIDRLSGFLPDGPVAITLPGGSGEGIGCAESAHGDIWHWLRLDHGHIAAVFPRDPAWALWPLAEAIMAGAPVEDIALIRCSLGLTVSGMDL